MNCLVVVAHPDDEVIWMGGTILRHCDWNWRVLVLTRASDPDRSPRFTAAVKAMGITGRMSDVDDSPALLPLSDDLHELTDEIAGLGESRYDLIFTHGIRGEYTGHPRHEQTHEAVCALAERGELEGELLFFAYDDCGGRCDPRPADDAQYLIRLTDDEYERKKHIVEEIYGFGEGSFEYRSAGNIEAFRACADERTSRIDQLLHAAADNGG